MILFLISICCLTVFLSSIFAKNWHEKVISSIRRKLFVMNLEYIIIKLFFEKNIRSDRGTNPCPWRHKHWRCPPGPIAQRQFFQYRIKFLISQILFQTMLNSMTRCLARKIRASVGCLAVVRSAVLGRSFIY